MTAITWKPDGLGREVAYFGAVQIGAVMPVPNLTARRAYDNWQWATWLPPETLANWHGAASEEAAKRAVERVASDWLARTGLGRAA